MKRFVVFLIGMISSLTFAKTNIVELKDQFLLPLKSCAERVWPGYSPLKDAAFAFTIPSENTSYLIKDDGSISQVPLQEWGEEAASPYTYVEKFGKKIILLNVDEYDNEDTLLETAYHEAFHFLGQEHLTPEVLVDREEVMPMNFNANSARTMQLRALKAFLRDNNKEHLQKASYWEKVIKNDFLEDWKSNQFFDITEGSAEFVGNYSLALSKLGCEATEKELSDFVLGYSEKLPDVSGKITQSYKAGQYAYMIARLNKLDDVFTTTSSSPATKILAGYIPYEESLDYALINEFKENFGYVNLIVDTAKQEVKSAQAFLAIPSEHAVGAIQGMGFYKIMVDSSPVMVFPGAKIKLSSDQGNIDLVDKNIIVQTEPVEMCGAMGTYYLIPVTDFLEVNQNAGLSGNSYQFEEHGTYLNKKVMCPLKVEQVQ